MVLHRMDQPARPEHELSRCGALDDAEMDQGDHHRVGIIPPCLSQRRRPLIRASRGEREIRVLEARGDHGLQHRSPVALLRQPAQPRTEVVIQLAATRCAGLEVQPDQFVDSMGATPTEGGHEGLRSHLPQDAVRRDHITEGVGLEGPAIERSQQGRAGVVVAYLERSVGGDPPEPVERRRDTEFIEFELDDVPDRATCGCDPRTVGLEIVDPLFRRGPTRGRNEDALAACQGWRDLQRHGGVGDLDIARGARGQHTVDLVGTGHHEDDRSMAPCQQRPTEQRAAAAGRRHPPVPLPALRLEVGLIEERRRIAGGVERGARHIGQGDARAEPEPTVLPIQPPNLGLRQLQELGDDAHEERSLLDERCVAPLLIRAESVLESARGHGLGRPPRMRHDLLAEHTEARASRHHAVTQPGHGFLQGSRLCARYRATHDYYLSC